MKARIARNIVLFWIGLCSELQVHAQTQAYVDSLNVRLTQVDDDSKRIHILNLLCSAYNRSRPDKARDYCKRAEVLALQIRDSLGLLQTLKQLGNIDYFQGNYARALDYYFESMAIAERRRDDDGIGRACNNIGEVYRLLGNHAKALEYFQRAQTHLLKSVNQLGLVFILNNVGETYRAMGDDVRARDMFLEALTVAQRQQDQVGLAYTWYNLGMSYQQDNKLEIALSFLNKSYTLAQQLNDKRTMAYSLNVIAQIYLQQNQLQLAAYYAKNSLTVSREVNNKARIRDALQTLALTYARLSDYAAAYRYQTEHMTMRDSLITDELNRKIIAAQTNYDISKKEREIALLQTQQALANQQRIFFIICIGLLAGLVFLLMRSTTLRKRNNQHLLQVNAAISQQQQEIVDKHRALQDTMQLLETQNIRVSESLHYARRIQQAILPYHERIAMTLPDFFILYKPRDIVSGDFYWFTEKNGLAIFAAADCTGHGVPGAFMSLIGEALLTQIIIDRSILHVEQILAEMHRGIRRALKQEDGDNRDGMDISICVYDMESNELYYAGANQPIFYTKGGQLLEMRPDRYPVGGMQREETRLFTPHIIRLQEPTMVYLFTDGFQDQFGGEPRRKYGYKAFRDFVQSIMHLPLPQQQTALDAELARWRGQGKQIDDVMVMCFKLPLAT